MSEITESIETLLAENKTFRAHTLVLERQIAELESKLQFLTSHQTLSFGMTGEKLISRLVNGKMTALTTSFDIVTDTEVKIEVKFARLNIAIKGQGTKRWAWPKVFGSSGKKEYDFLVLIGDKDERWADRYADANAPFVFFCIPYPEVGNLTISTAGVKAIHLTTNPETALRGRSSSLFGRYQTTSSELEKRFGI